MTYGMTTFAFSSLYSSSSSIAFSKIEPILSVYQVCIRNVVNCGLFIKGGRSVVAFDSALHVSIGWNDDEDKIEKKILQPQMSAEKDSKL